MSVRAGRRVELEADHERERGGNIGRMYDVSWSPTGLKNTMMKRGP